MTELYKKHRPRKLSQVVGQSEAVKMLKNKAKKENLPHSFLFSGPSGCGKTTLARIVAKLVNCGKHDLQEINCADFRGIDTIRELRSRMTQAPISGSARAYIIDECHKLSNDAQNAFLKLLEDTPSHVYFLLATTEPNKVIKTIRTRCTEISCKSLSDYEIATLIDYVLAKEEATLSTSVVQKIVENSDGSARKALVYLDQVLGLDDKKDQLESIVASSTETAAIEIARALNNRKTTWPAMAKILKEADLKDAEGIRYLVLAYSKSVLLSRADDRAYLILDVFRDNFYDSKEYGLVHACYTIIKGA
jgi:DNA polymerase-3 subunit gamma/tau